MMATGSMPAMAASNAFGQVTMPPAANYHTNMPVATAVPALTAAAQLESARAFLRVAGYHESELQGDLTTLTAMVRNLRQG